MCLHDLVSQIVTLKVAMRKQTFFCLSAPYKNEREYLHSIYFYWRSEFSSRAVLCNIHLLRQLRVPSSSISNIECIFVLPVQQWLGQLANILRFTYIVFVVNLFRTVEVAHSIKRQNLYRSNASNCTDAHHKSAS